MISSLHYAGLARCVLLSGMVAGAFGLSFASPSVQADVHAGATRAQVVAAWGAPIGVVTRAGQEVLLYPNGTRIELREGIVVRVVGAPQAPDETAAPPLPTPAGAAVPPPFLPMSNRAAEIPFATIEWADSPHTREMFSANVHHGRDRPALHRIRGRDAERRLREALDAGADANHVDSVSRTALHRQAEPGPYANTTVKRMRMLIDSGAEVNARDQFGQTPLHVAAPHAYLALEYLIEAGADVNAVDHLGQTPLHLAVESRNDGARDILLANGADATIADNAGFTIDAIAREQGRWVARHRFDGQAQALAFGNQRFVACGPHFRSTLISVDGAAWREQPAPENSGLAGVAYAGEGFWAWGTHRGFYSSKDGLSWLALDVPDNPLPYSFAAAGPQRIVVMGRSSTVAHSPDGRHWQTLPEGVAAEVLGLAWTGGRYLAVNRDAVVFCSTDGLHWGRLRLDLQGLALKRVRLANGELFGIGYGGLMLRSRDGVQWRHIPLPVRDALYDIAWGGGTYAAVGQRGLVLFSEDGINWRVRRTAEPTDFLAVEYGNNAFVALSRSALWSFHH